MSDNRHDDAGPANDAVQSRRSFLTTLGVAGVGLTAGAARGAPQVIRPVPQAGGRRATGRATGKLQVQASVQVSSTRARNASEKIDMMQRVSSPPAPTPSSRERAIGALLDSPASNLTPASLGITGTAADYSAALSAIADQNALAAACAEGITLKPWGCEYTEGAQYDGEDPMFYSTRCGHITPAFWGQNATTAVKRIHSRSMSISLETPGTEDNWMSYIMELAMQPFNSSEFTVTLEKMVDNGVFGMVSELSFAPTSDGTHLAIASVTGSGQNYPSGHLSFDHGGAGTSLLQDASGSFRASAVHFQWLNVTAI